MTELAVNDAGEACLFHRDPFPSPPQAATYDGAAGRLVLLLEDGGREVLTDGLPSEMAAYLALARTLLVVRMDGDIPVAGWEVAVRPADHG